MTRYYHDIIEQPRRLTASLDHSLHGGQAKLAQAASLIRSSSCIYISGIGASWCAAVAIHSRFMEIGVAAVLMDASELLHYGKLQQNSTVMLLSRSGKSTEILSLVPKCRKAGARIISITNNVSGELASASDVCLHLAVEYDHSISVGTYTSIVLTGHLLAEALTEMPRQDLSRSLSASFAEVEERFAEWQETVESADWINDNPYCFLARGASLATAYESMLLWHEVLKRPATAMSTGSFRHGSQEVLAREVNIALWINNDRTKEYDMQLAIDLAHRGASLLLIGSDLSPSLPGTHLTLPETIHPYQNVIDIIPVQLLSNHAAKQQGIDPDTFLYCNFIVESEGGL